MGGHGGLNILPQKRWNVYNFENREKVRKDEEAAAREEQTKAADSRRRDSEFRLERLRHARGIALPAVDPRSDADPPPSDAGHINLFDGIEDFHSVASSSKKHDRPQKDGSLKELKKRKEDRPVVVSAEDEKYRMGYGVAGKGVKAPWYLARPSAMDLAEEKSGNGCSTASDSGKGSGRKKTIEELREERLKREKLEKKRQRAVLGSARK
ncbi:leukocyte receptor cluster-like protein [Wolffia australiana]